MGPLFKCLLIQMVAGLLFLANLSVAHAQPLPFDRAGAVILAYQRVGDDLYPAATISKEQFAENIQELTNDDYHIVKLSDLVDALKTNSNLPDRVIAITFDGAYRSFLDNAAPLLIDRNLPFTVFFSPDQVDSNTPQYLNWNDIKRLKKYSNVTLGLHPANYSRLTDSPPAEIRRQINKAIARYRQELKTDPVFFAYPFGEYTKTYRAIIAQSGFKAAFGQQSGAAWSGSDIFALPRFPITESYGDDERFRMVAASMPLPVEDIAPDDPHITSPNPPIFGFTLDPALVPKLNRLSCFISEQEKPDMQIIGENRVELRITRPFESDRIRVNCTMPGPTAKPGEEQRWRWFGMLLGSSRPE